MSLSLAEVEHIAELARLELSAEEKERYRQQLSAILEYAARLQAVDTSQVLPTASALEGTNGALAGSRRALRPDRAEQYPAVAAILANAPQTEENQFCVPPVLE